MKTRRRPEVLGWLLCAPAVAVMTVVAGYPMIHAFLLSLERHDLRFPDARTFVGLSNYETVLTSEVWWQAFFNTFVITVISVAIELVLGFALAYMMHRAIFARGLVRTSVLVPYTVITVVAALVWRFAFDPAAGFVNGLLGLEGGWLVARGWAFVVIIATEIWKTTPFMALLLLAGLATVPEDLLRSARVDGASAWQRLIRITLPIMRPTILVAVLFRTLDAFRIFDTVFVQTRGALDTATVSIVGYEVLISRLNLGLGSAVSVLIFVSMTLIALVIVVSFGVRIEAEDIR